LRQPVLPGAPPIDLFVGRQRELDAILRRVLGAESSRIEVVGPAGVGKTTCIQYAKHRLVTEHGFAAASEHIRMPHRLTVQELAAEILRAVVRSLRTALTPKQLESIDGMAEATSLVEHASTGGWSFSLSAAGFGGGAGVNRTDQPASFPPLQLHDIVARLVRAARGAGVKGIAVHLNNVENLQRDPTAGAVLMRDARDYFLIPGLHWLIGATEDFRGAILNVYPQVRSIFQVDIQLDPLSLAELKQLLERRYEHLRIDGAELVVPIEDELVTSVHELFAGDLRGALAALEEACFRALGLTGLQPLDLTQALRHLRPFYQQRLSEDLSTTELEHLRRIAATGQREFRQADVLDVVDLSAGRVSKLFAALARASAIVLVRTDGRSRYYALSGRARIALEDLSEL